jgi:hypothetical protein
MGHLIRKLLLTVLHQEFYNQTGRLLTKGDFKPLEIYSLAGTKISRGNLSLLAYLIELDMGLNEKSRKNT